MKSSPPPYLKELQNRAKQREAIKAGNYTELKSLLLKHEHPIQQLLIKSIIKPATKAIQSQRTTRRAKWEALAVKPATFPQDKWKIEKDKEFKKQLDQHHSTVTNYLKCFALLLFHTHSFPSIDIKNEDMRDFNTIQSIYLVANHIFKILNEHQIPHGVVGITLSYWLSEKTYKIQAIKISKHIFFKNHKIELEINEKNTDKIRIHALDFKEFKENQTIKIDSAIIRFENNQRLSVNFEISYLIYDPDRAINRIGNPEAIKLDILQRFLNIIRDKYSNVKLATPNQANQAQLCSLLIRELRDNYISTGIEIRSVVIVNAKIIANDLKKEVALVKPCLAMKL